MLQQSRSTSVDFAGRTEQQSSLDLEDIQHFLMSRPPARAARYEFLTFRSAAGGRAWLKGLIEKVGTAKAVGSSQVDSRWVTIGFTWAGLRALGVGEGSLATFPEEFRQGMAARAQILGTTGANDPDHWVGGLAGPNLHAITNISATATGSRSQSSRELEWSLHPVLARRSNQVNFFLAILMRKVWPPEYRSRKFFPETAATSLI